MGPGRINWEGTFINGGVDGMENLFCLPITSGKKFAPNPEGVPDIPAHVKYPAAVIKAWNELRHNTHPHVRELYLKFKSMHPEFVANELEFEYAEEKGSKACYRIDMDMWELLVDGEWRYSVWLRGRLYECTTADRVDPAGVVLMCGPRKTQKAA